MPRAHHNALLLVDGYNIVGAWPHLKEIRDGDGLEAARNALVECLASYSSFRGYKTQLIFDAQYQENPGREEPVTRYLSIRYTEFRQTADTLIELTCAQFRHDLRKYDHRLIVATSDRAQQLTVVGYGAEWMSANHLLNDVEAASRQTHRHKKSVPRQAANRLSNRLDPVAQQRLAALRMGLKPKQ
ncbi:MAG: NYN domain-containing protein [Synechococcales cyanobacterium T60_A2020_003]|nr:NYN domain-containing protein [Synechococcales cyanobacterium T60_A2020_003]